MAPPLDEVHPLTSQWPPGISVILLSKEFLNTFQVIQFCSLALLDKDRFLKTWKFTWEERGHTHFVEQRWVSFYFSAASMWIAMLCQGGNEVEEFRWLHTFLGKNQSTKCVMGNRRHRKEKQWQSASNLQHKGQAKTNRHGLSEVVRLFSH